MSVVKCPNYKICNSYLKIVNEKVNYGNDDNEVNIECSPMLDDNGNYTILKLSKPLPVCSSCGIVYSDVEDEYQSKCLSFVDNIECCICLQMGDGVSYPNCLHYTCIDCHNRCWFGPTPVELEFPYPDIKHLFYTTRTSEVWKKDAKIRKWIEEDSRLEYIRMSQWESEKNLRNCAICRS